MLSSNPPEAKDTATICWIVGTVVLKDLHLCVNTKYQATLRGPSYGYGYFYNEQGSRCRVIDYLTTLVVAATYQGAKADVGRC